MSIDMAAQQQAARERFERENRAEQRKLRLQGIAIAGVGILLNAVNAFMVIANGSFFVVTLFAGPVMLFLGIWLAAFGRPIDLATGQPAKWGNAGLVATIALGVAAGIAGFVFLKS